MTIRPAGAPRQAGGGFRVGGAVGRPNSAVVPAEPIVPFSYATRSMGGQLVIHLDVDETHRGQASRTAAALARRIECWAARLTRYSESSDLSHLNRDPREDVPVRPTLAAVLEVGRRATELSAGIVDVTMLDARLAAEGLGAGDGRAWRGRDWSLTRGRRGTAIVRRPSDMRFDIDGVGKGWIADRALRLLATWPSVVVDADGDLAIRIAPGKVWEVAVDDPRALDGSLGTLRLTANRGVPGQWGVATSGTSVHRWNVDGRQSHHLIDPRTGIPAATDVVQATVVAGSALRAEELAKAAVIAGSYHGLALLERARVHGAILLTDRGEVMALPQTIALLGS